MKIEILRAFSDNYVFMLLDESGREAAAVDPGDAGPVLDYLRRTGRRLTAILNTHHHRDHVGGNLALIGSFPRIPVYGAAGDRGRIPGQTAFLTEGDRLTVSGAAAQVLDVPGHTRCHVAYYFPPAADDSGDLFSGDTIFGGTIGNLFEETPDVMFRSVQKIRALRRKTRLWCAHEYTLQYVREAAGIDEQNARLSERLRALEGTAAAGQSTVPLSLEEECATNPFFRWDDEALAARLSAAPGLEVFRRLCEIT